MKIGYIICTILFINYLLIPNLKFPEKIDDSLTSNEPADTEDIKRRAYFTNYKREEVIEYYIDQFKNNYFLHVVKLPTFRLNYPPEEAQIIIRDQTRSTYLEEIVHPFRESIFINGFEPKDPKDTIIIENKNWRQKIIVKAVNSNIYIRLLIGVITLLIIPYIYKSWIETINDFIKVLSKLWNFR